MGPWPGFPAGIPAALPLSLLTSAMGVRPRLGLGEFRLANARRPRSSPEAAAAAVLTVVILCAGPAAPGPVAGAAGRGGGSREQPAPLALPARAGATARRPGRALPSAAAPARVAGSSGVKPGVSPAPRARSPPAASQLVSLAASPAQSSASWAGNALGESSCPMTFKSSVAFQKSLHTV